MLNYLFLILAIVAEAAGTTLLKMSEQFTKLVPSIASLVCYVASLYLLSLCLRTIPIGIAYATWSALGIALITISGIFFFKQMPDLGAIIGLVLIISGVAVLNLFKHALERVMMGFTAFVEVVAHFFIEVRNIHAARDFDFLDANFVHPLFSLGNDGLA